MSFRDSPCSMAIPAAGTVLLRLIVRFSAHFAHRALGEELPFRDPVFFNFPVECCPADP